MADVIQALSNSITFEGFMRTLDLLVMVYMLRVLSILKLKIDMLHDWHAPDDPRFPERKIWWSDPTVSEALHEIASNGKEANKHLMELRALAAAARP